MKNLLLSLFLCFSTLLPSQTDSLYELTMIGDLSITYADSITIDVAELYYSIYGTDVKESIYVDDDYATHERLVNLTGGITEYFIEVDSTAGGIEYIFVFEAPRRVIGYARGFKSVFDLEYVPSVWMHDTQEVILETMFCDMIIDVKDGQGHIYCNDTDWRVYKTMTFGR